MYGLLRPQNRRLFGSVKAIRRLSSMYKLTDVQTHYVSFSYNGAWKDALVGFRRRAREMGVNPKLSGDTGTMIDLSWENYVREVFLDSETYLALISIPPGPYPWEAKRNEAYS